MDIVQANKMAKTASLTFRKVFGTLPVSCHRSVLLRGCPPRVETLPVGGWGKVVEWMYNEEHKADYEDHYQDD